MHACNAAPGQLHIAAQHVDPYRANRAQATTSTIDYTACQGLQVTSTNWVTQASPLSPTVSNRIGMVQQWFIKRQRPCFEGMPPAWLQPAQARPTATASLTVKFSNHLPVCSLASHPQAQHVTQASTPCTQGTMAGDHAGH